MKHVSRKLLALGAVLCVVVLVGCASPLPFVPYPEGITAPRTVAVMPLENLTDSDQGAVFIRKEMQRNLKQKGYLGKSLSDVDRLLSEQFPGEVSTDRIQRIGNALGVDAVITGTLQRFGLKLGLPSEEYLEASFAIHETQTGKLIWQYHDSYSQFNLTPLGQEFIGGLLTGMPHATLVRNFCQKLLKEMPNGAESTEYEVRN